MIINCCDIDRCTFSSQKNSDNKYCLGWIKKNDGDPSKYQIKLFNLLNIFRFPPIKQMAILLIKHIAHILLPQQPNIVGEPQIIDLDIKNHKNTSSDQYNPQLLVALLNSIYFPRKFPGYQDISVQNIADINLQVYETLVS